MFKLKIETNYIWLVLFAVILPLVALKKKNDKKYEKNLKDNEIYLDSLFRAPTFFKNIRYIGLPILLIFLNQRPNFLENIPIKSTVFAFLKIIKF